MLKNLPWPSQACMHMLHFRAGVNPVDFKGKVSKAGHNNFIVELKRGLPEATEQSQRPADLPNPRILLLLLESTNHATGKGHDV